MYISKNASRTYTFSGSRSDWLNGVISTILALGTEDDEDDVGRGPGERGKGGVPTLDDGVPGGEEDALFHDGLLRGHSDPI